MELLNPFLNVPEESTLTIHFIMPSGDDTPGFLNGTVRSMDLFALDTGLLFKLRDLVQKSITSFFKLMDWGSLRVVDFDSDLLRLLLEHRNLPAQDGPARISVSPIL